MNQTADNVRLIVVLLLIALGVALLARWAKLPYTLGLVVVGLMIGIFHLLPGVVLTPDIVLFIFLPALLFEGAWNLEQRELLRNWLPIALLAGPGLGISVVIVGLILHLTVGLSWSVAFLLGAIISPTDPVAVIALLRRLGIATRLRVLIEGESLFNDGVAAALTQVLLGLTLAGAAAGAAAPHQNASAGQIAGEIALSLLQLMGGGIALGLVIGYLVSRLVRYVDDHLIETTITAVVAYGTYLLADVAHVSGILAVITAALLLGSYGRQTGMATHTQEAVDGVWDFAAYIANSLLFLLVGMEIVRFPLTDALAAIFWSVVSVVLGRALMIYLLIPLYNLIARRLIATRLGPHIAPGLIPRRWRLLLLGTGLRGALSLALVLSLPLATPNRNELILIVYGVVLVTLLGQGFGLRFLLSLFRRESQSSTRPEQ
jgi:CPA1 family monovalent cation:H+ antiporter